MIRSDRIDSEPSNKSRDMFDNDMEPWLLDSSFFPLPSRESSYAPPSQKLLLQERETTSSSSFSKHILVGVDPRLSFSSAGTTGDKKNLSLTCEERDRHREKDCTTNQKMPVQGALSSNASIATTRRGAGSKELDSPTSRSSKNICRVNTDEDMDTLLSLLISSCAGDTSDKNSQSRRGSIVNPQHHCSSDHFEMKRTFVQPSSFLEENHHDNHKDNAPSLFSFSQPLSAAESLMRSRLLTIDDQERQESSRQLDTSSWSQNYQQPFIPHQITPNKELLINRSNDGQSFYQAHYIPTKTTFKQRNFLSTPMRQLVPLESSKTENTKNQLQDYTMERSNDIDLSKDGEGAASDEMMLGGLGKTEEDEDEDWKTTSPTQDFSALSSQKSSSIVINEQRSQSLKAGKKRNFATSSDNMIEETSSDSSTTNSSTPFIVKRFKSFHEDKWNDHFTRLQQYKATYGDCLVPHSFPPDTLLARWVKRQRRQYKLFLENDSTSTMTSERIDQLNSEGFVWDSHEATWMAKYNMLVQFRNQYGHCCVPSSNKKTAFSQLATWVKCQRRLFRIKNEGKKCAMTDRRVDLLNQIKFAWEVR